jgi:hypothetical protein
VSTRPRHHASRRWSPSRSAVIAVLAVVILGTVPVLVPLLVTRGDDGDGRPAGLAAGAGVPALPRGEPGAEPVEDEEERPLPAAGTLVPTRAARPSPSPSATPTAAPTTPGTPQPTRPSTAAAPPTTPPSVTPPPTTPPPTPPPTTLAAAPDLVVVSVSWAPEEVAAGAAVTFTAVVRNAGTEPTPAVAHGVGFAVDGTRTSWSAAGSTPLAPGEERTYTADGGPAGPTWTATPGEHELRAYVDEVDRIGETDDGNNVMTTTLTVP